MKRLEIFLYLNSQTHTHTNKAIKFFKKDLTTMNKIKKLFRMFINDSIHKHDWKEFTKIYKHTVYYCRNCKCGLDQVKYAGPLGDNKWHNITDDWKWSWEKEQFEKSKRV